MTHWYCSKHKEKFRYGDVCNSCIAESFGISEELISSNGKGVDSEAALREVRGCMEGRLGKKIQESIPCPHCNGTVVRATTSKWECDGCCYSVSNDQGHPVERGELEDMEKTVGPDE
jgi:protein-arginine kinase activator protein McsA